MASKPLVTSTPPVRRASAFRPQLAALTVQSSSIRLPASRPGWKEHLDRCLATVNANGFDRPENLDVLTREREKLAQLWVEDRNTLLKRFALIFLLIPTVAFFASQWMDRRWIIWSALAVTVVTMILGLWSTRYAIFFQSPRAARRRHDLMPAEASGWFLKRLKNHPSLLSQVEALKVGPLGFLKGDRRVIERYLTDLKIAKRR
jgi:hypothetical protein